MTKQTDKQIENINFDYSTYGDGKAIIEILNIGFEPLLLPDEYKIYKEIGNLKYLRNGILRTLKFINSKLLYVDEDDCYYKWLMHHKLCLEEKLDFYKEKEKYKEQIFRSLMQRNKSKTRKIYSNRDFKSEEQFRNIAIFESDLNRCFGCKDMEHSDDIISVVTYYTEIFDSIIHNGFDYKGRHFVFFTAGAGQTRCKKVRL